MDLKPLLSPTELLKLMNLIRESNRILLCGHRGPDGDAVGAVLGWASYLRTLGKNVRIVLPNRFPDFLCWMPGSDKILFHKENETRAREEINAADLIFMMDFCEVSRLGDMGKDVAAAKAKKVVVDHHLNPCCEGADLLISHPEACSTCFLVFKLIEQLGGYDSLTRSAAACIYTGMMTDTGSFTYASADPEIYYTIGLLLQKGIDKDKIYRNVFHTYSEHRVRFIGYVLNEKLRFHEGNRASIFTITREEMKRFRYIRGDAEGLVNMPLQVKGMRLSISLREDTETDVVRVSLRSVDDFPCNKMAETHFHGGGHLNASGGELPFPLEEAVRTAEKAIADYRELL